MTITANGTELPTSVRVGGTPRLSPNELRTLKVLTGRTLQELFSDEADAMQSMVWVKLRREGYTVTWEQAGDVEAEMGADPADPTKLGSSQMSLPSADTGE
jgi:hypothetical protein